MTIRINRVLCFLVAVFFSVTGAFAQDTPESLSRGLREYQAGQFATALVSFQTAKTEAAGGEYQAFADFWVARSLMALGRFGEASDGFDLFLIDHPGHPYAEEAGYQRARLYYLTEEYEAAVQGFAVFREEYPASDFSANALYWTGESLFELGLLTEARNFFVEVTERYPTSFRVEAARYRSDIIDLSQRENELLTLLQWSHEEYLSSLDEFRQKELAYQEALQSYRERLGSLAAEDFREEIEVLNGRVSELESTIAERDARINELLAALRQAQADADLAGEALSAAGTQPAVTSAAAAETSSTPTASVTAGVQSELLSLKAAALELQQRLMSQGGGQ